MDDRVCVMRGAAGSSDTPVAEVDDALDVTADCVFGPEGPDPL
jgi:hypothetical protein